MSEIADEITLLGEDYNVIYNPKKTVDRKSRLNPRKIYIFFKELKNCIFFEES